MVLSGLNLVIIKVLISMYAFQVSAQAAGLPLLKERCMTHADLPSSSKRSHTDT